VKVSIAAERCIGAGNCVEVAPRVFTQSDKDGIAVVLQEDVPTEEQEAVEQAVDICPVGAVLLARAAAAQGAA
jgi:ferredoxin